MKDEEEIIIIERGEGKTISDLTASIKDGRYKEQSYRLDGYSIHNHNIIYLIEGNLNRASFDKKTIYSSMFSIGYCKGFSSLANYVYRGICYDYM